MRAESFRKALVYQKKYLLLLLGGFQDCEAATLSMIAKMGGHPSSDDVQSKTVSPLTRFRSAVRTVVAITRMKFLVKKWRRATRVGSSAVAGTSNHTGISNGYVPTSGSFVSAVPSNRLSHSASEIRQSHSSHVRPSTPTHSQPAFSEAGPRIRNHSRSFQTPPTRDSSRDEPMSLRGHRRGVSGDAGACSPDREEALTAYIDRLEHLQDRLGTVTQSSSDFSPSRR